MRAGRFGADSGSIATTHARDEDHRRIPAMDKGLAVLITAVAGGLIALQAPINAGLGRATGNLPAALVSFVVGTFLLVR
jgi:hypothetical protein